MPILRQTRWPRACIHSCSQVWRARNLGPPISNPSGERLRREPSLEELTRSQKGPQLNLAAIDAANIPAEVQGSGPAHVARLLSLRAIPGGNQHGTGAAVSRPAGGPAQLV